VARRRPPLGGILKSDVSDLLEVLDCIYIDAFSNSIADLDLRDLKTIRSRVKEEGLSFLTITLPSFARDFERSLADGFVAASSFQNFRKFGSIPAFLRGMIGLIFNHETGRIFDDDSLKAYIPCLVDSVRQICLAYKKILVPCTQQRTWAAIEGFVETEQFLQESSVPNEDIISFTNVSFMLWSRVLANLRLDTLVPKHGPGATAERLSGNQKYVWKYWHERLEQYFPFLSNGLAIGAFDSLDLEMVTFIPEEKELPVRVVPVPKTLKAPRIIAIEPVCMQFAQQGIQNALVSAIESSDSAGGSVNFSDQSVNQSFAISSSKSNLFATIDLSDASDRVPRNLALKMFDSNPDLRDAIDACRSTRAILPDGRVIGPLAKFASMGSALCFPIESMYFYTICVMALLDEYDLPVTYSNCCSVGKYVRVYGDDIIVPSNSVMTVLSYLQKYHCKVNSHKSFWTGKFRESCGVDAYDGIPVKPVYIRRLLPENRRQASELISIVSSANQFYRKGFWRTASVLFKRAESILGPLPYVSSTCSALGRESFLGYRSVSRWNDKLQRLEIRAWVPKSISRTDSIEGYSALTKSLLGLHSSIKKDVAFEDALHLKRSALHGAVAIQRRWVNPS
jgi:hypothetical protein